jgi:hypothetical protein
MLNPLSPIVEDRIVAFALAHPGLGPKRIASELVAEIFRESSPYNVSWKDGSTHRAFQARVGMVDHVLPGSAGRRDWKRATPPPLATLKGVKPRIRGRP